MAALRQFLSGKFFIAVGFVFVVSLGLALTLTAVGSVDFEISEHPLLIETQNGPVSFTIEVAGTAQERAQGLMNRAEMPEDHGMLFDFEVARDVSMWMKNTILPLDMLFISSDGVIQGTAEHTVPFSEAIINSPGPIRYVLEINAGMAAKHGIEPGDLVKHPRIAPE